MAVGPQNHVSSLRADIRDKLGKTLVNGDIWWVGHCLCDGLGVCVSFWWFVWPCSLFAGKRSSPVSGSGHCGDNNKELIITFGKSAKIVLLRIHFFYSPQTVSAFLNPEVRYKIKFFAESLYSGSSFEFTEFWIQAKVPDPCGSGSNPYYLSILGNYKKYQSLYIS